MTTKTPEQIAEHFYAEAESWAWALGRKRLIPMLVSAIEADRRQMDVFTAQEQRAHGIAVIRSLNELNPTTAQAGNPEYLRGQAELLASLTSGGDMDTALASTYAELGVAAL